ncbi:hypothetical protein CMI39_03115 [Candidatus Pacearchaeota archaeon]|jgi:hypothetical protein|nr:hypothetical protein [Candidatus Pacearchaeota archaeon]|tara:strand:- start:3460 stop:4701 length:1242 start_codon:yes stop_codon:yes gene_type:complete
MSKITNPQLKELDKKTAKFYKLSHRYLKNLVNLYGRDVYKAELSDILKKTDGITPETEFDELVLRNIQSNLQLNNLTLDYFTDPNFSLSVREFFDKITGKGSYEFLEERVKSPPWEKRWKNVERTQERNYTKVSPFTEEAQTIAKTWIPRIKEDILTYGKAKNLLPKDFDMTLLLLPPKEGSEWSNWNSITRVFSLGSYGFDFFHRDKEGIIAIPTDAYRVAFHEVLGHGAHQIHSRDMPLSTRFTEEVGGITPTKSITEGVAISSEKRAYEFLRNRLEDLGITKEDVDILQVDNELIDQTRLEMMYYSLIKDRELKEKGFDGYEHLLNLTKNPVIARAFKEDFKGSFEDLWGQIGHTLGPLHYQKMKDTIERKFGEEYLKKEKKKFNTATLTGVWSWEVYPDAVSYTLKEMK